MARQDFALPDLGEGLTESVIVSWHVAEGDTVALNQPLAEVETAKALVELPSPFAGVVSRLYAEAGTTVEVGARIISFEIEGVDAPDVSPAPAEAREAEGSEDATPAREPVLVGYGAPIETGKRPARRARKDSGTDARAKAAEGTVAGAGAPRGAESLPGAETASAVGSSAPVRSTPPVRKLARDRGIDIKTLTGTGPKGLVTRDDVERATSAGPAVSGATAAARVAQHTVPLGAIDETRVTRTPIQGVRKHTAAAMVASAFTAPHASEFLTIDVTPTLELIETLKASSAYRGVRLNLLALVAKAVCLSVARNPQVNVRWDEAAQEIIQFQYVNLGIAAATPRGLMVPNIKEADSLELPALATALGELIESAKAGRSSPAELSGGTLSITNIGVFGIDAGTPILPPGEAMILALGAVKRLPWEYRGEIALRNILTLSISFDHRMVDGEQASRFLADVGSILAQPASLIAMV